MGVIEFNKRDQVILREIFSLMTSFCGCLE